MFKQEINLILASHSWGRKYVLDLANIQYSIGKNLISDEQETSFKETVEHLNIFQQIEKISDYKGLKVSKENPHDYIISGDQASVMEGDILLKPKNKAEAIAQLTAYAGKVYHLITSVSLCKNGKVLWRHQETPTVQLRHFGMKEAEIYVNREERSETGSVVGIAGACKIESPYGLHMVKNVNGSHYTIIGLPLHALIDELYRLKILN